MAPVRLHRPAAPGLRRVRAAVGGLPGGRLADRVGYQRFRWFGTLFLPVALLPIGAVEFLLDTWRAVPPGTPPLDTAGAGLPLGAALPLAAGVVALGLLAGRWLLHTVPLRPGSA